MLPFFMIGVLALLAGFVAAEVAALRHWRGAWRVLAMAPLGIVLFVVVRIVVDVLRDPTSHNLWPFEIIIWSGFGLVVLALTAGAQALSARRSNQR